MKKRHLLVSLMTLVLCLTLISGATFALFTSESKVNIAVTSGKVEVKATIEDLKIYSLDVEQTNGTFENGGTATFDENADLHLNLLTPGDKATFTIKMDNTSNVTVQYRIVLAIEGELASGLVSKAVFDNKEYSLSNGATRWFNLAAGADIPDVAVEVALPLEAGNEYQNKNALITVKVEVVQGNAETVDEWNGTADTTWYLDNQDAQEYVLYTAEELAGFAALVNGATTQRAVNETFAGKVVKLGANIDLCGIEWTAIGDPKADNFVGFAGTFDGQGYKIANLSIDKPASWGQGLFGYNINKSTVIKNFTIENVTINAEDTSGAVAGYYYFGTIENVKVNGNVAIKGAQDMGGIVGNGYYTNIYDCSVIANEGSYVTATTNSFVGGIVGYHGEGNFEILNNTVKNLTLTAYGAVGVVAGFAGYNVTITGSNGENVVLNKTSVDNCPSIGLVIGSYTTNTNGYTTNISNNTFNNITLNGQSKEYPHNILIGSHYDGLTDPFTGTLENNVYENITNNVRAVVKVESSAQFQDAIKKENTIVVLNSDVNVGSTQLAIDTNVTIDLNGNTLNTANNWGGITIKNGGSIKNGTINHTGNTAAIKAFQVGTIENVTINVTPTDGKVKGGIVVQSGDDKYIDAIKNVTITGATNGIETYNCGGSNRSKPAIGLMENVVIDATDTGISLSATIGKAVNCTIKGAKYGINMLLKGEYAVHIELENCTVNGSVAGIWAHDEKGISNTNNCSLVLTIDQATTIESDLIWDFEDECQSVITLNK